jgi:hypothetical protein
MRGIPERKHEGNNMQRAGCSAATTDHSVDA